MKIELTELPQPLTNQQVNDLFEALQFYKTVLMRLKARKVIVENMAILKPEVEKMQEVQNGELQKFDDARIELLKKHAKTDENGELETDSKDIAVFENDEASGTYRAAYKAYREEHAEDLEELAKFGEELSSITKIAMLSEDDLPDVEATPQVYKAMQIMLSE